MSIGPIVKSPPASSNLRAAGVVLLGQAALRAFFLASFLTVLARYPRVSEAIFSNLYPLITSVVQPAFFVVSGVVVGLLLLARIRAGAGLAAAFCILGLLAQGFAAVGIGFAALHTSHHPPTQTYVLMALNTAIYLWILIAVARSA